MFDINQENATLLHKIRQAVSTLYMSSKNYKFLFSHIDKLSYLNLENYFFQTKYKNQATSLNSILLQTANIYPNNDSPLDSNKSNPNCNNIEI